MVINTRSQKLILLSICLVNLISFAKGVDEANKDFTDETFKDDYVKDLPYYNYKTSSIYSGYLDVFGEKQFHYVLVLAQENPMNKPIVLWLNGGPGCSSLDGWINENGPMRMVGENKFEKNENSWNKDANMLYLESPADVGFSYVSSNLDTKKEINDDIAAQDNLQALLRFFKKFTPLKGKPIYIAGESYAGIYVPMLAYNILQYNKNKEKSEQINLKGIIVGNGVADWNYDVDNAMVDFAFGHYLISYETRIQYNKYCILTKDEAKCSEVMNKIQKTLEAVNIYDYLRKCYLPLLQNGELDRKSSYYLRASYAFRNYEKYRKTSKNSDLLKDKMEEKKLSSSYEYCIDDTNIEKYFNLDEVKSALHVKSTIKYSVCSSEVSKRYVIQDKGSIWAYKDLIAAGLKILIYSGDTDLAVPFNGNKKWIDNLGLEVISEYRTWRVPGDNRNIAGFYERFKGGLVFSTIKATGHMAPKWKSKELYYLVSKFLANVI